MMSVAYFLLLIGALVLIHEFGHFIAAKSLGIRVEVFSFGFGPSLWKKKLGETYYQIGLLPLGGYVRLLGGSDTTNVPKRLRAFAFCERPLWQKLVVLSGGPLANLILPVLIYFPLFLGQSSLPAAVVGDVLTDTPAGRAGLAPGDAIIAVDGTPVRYWKELEKQIEASESGELTIKLQRGSKQITRYLSPLPRKYLDHDGVSRTQNFVGIVREPLLPRVGLIEPSSPAAQAGIQTGDVVLAINGKFIASASEVSKRLGKARRATISFAHVRETQVPGVILLTPQTVNLVVPQALNSTGELELRHGLDRSADLLVSNVQEQSLAWRLGLRPGDLISEFDGEPVATWFEFSEKMRLTDKQKPTVRWFRQDGDKLIELEGTLTIGQKKQRFGATHDQTRGDPTLIPVDGRLRHAVANATGRTIETISVIGNAIWSIARGRDPNTEIGGPLTMFHAASESGKQGWEAFLILMALISVSVGLINLLPVPVLDGGQILILLWEKGQRRRLTAKTRSRLTLFGIGIVVWLTLVALKNDLYRYIL